MFIASIKNYVQHFLEVVEDSKEYIGHVACHALNGLLDGLIEMGVEKLSQHHFDAIQKVREDFIAMDGIVAAEVVSLCKVSKAYKSSEKKLHLIVHNAGAGRAIVKVLRFLNYKQQFGPAPQGWCERELSKWLK